MDRRSRSRSSSRGRSRARYDRSGFGGEMGSERENERGVRRERAGSGSANESLRQNRRRGYNRRSSSFAGRLMDQINNLGKERILLGIVILVVVSILIFVGLNYGPSWMTQIGVVLNNFFSKLLAYLVYGLVAWGVIMLFFGRRIPNKGKGILLIVVMVLTVLCMFTPQLGYTLITLLIIVCIIKLLIHS